MSSLQNYLTADAFGELIAFIKEQIGEDNISVDRSTMIEDDLGVTGDEADELIINISKKYHVDISDFDFGKYFYSEPSIFPVYGKKPPLTIGHIEKAIITGRLNEEVINGSSVSLPFTRPNPLYPDSCTVSLPPNTPA